jgi:uncharacterized protein YecE (DUF72 family)
MIHLGTSSWAFDTWRGVFYPDKLPSARYLAYYVEQFDTVEVNTSFYAIPAPSTVINWVTEAPPGFTFALKFPRVISHEKKLVGAENETLAFLEVLRSMGAAAGPAFLQLPPDFTRRSNGRNLAVYLDWLATQHTDLRLAVEVRSADLMTPAFAAFLAERGFVLVLVDRVGTLDLFPIWAEQLERASSPRFAMIRWIGDDKSGPQGDRELQTLRDAQLAQWAERLARLAEYGLDVFGYMHNPYEGHAPASVRRLRNFLAQFIEMPAWSPQPTGSEPKRKEQLALL